jgi:hypothetical protein
MSASGTVSLANARLSLVAGTAFVDFSSAGTLTPYLNYRLVLTDSAGKKAIGYIKSAGTGEMLGEELVTNGTFDSDIDGWALTNNGGTIAWDAGTMKFTEPATSQNMYASQNITSVAGALYLAQFTVTASDSVHNNLRIGTVATGNQIASSSISLGAGGPYSLYFTSTQASIYISGRYAGIATNTANHDNYTLKQVLTPSATGVTITSTPGGTAYNWASVESGFNYNDASGYSYAIYAVPRRKSNWNAQCNYYYRRNK